MTDYTEPGFTIRTYNDVQILMDRYPFNHWLRIQAIWAVRHPNKKMKEIGPLTMQDLITLNASDHVASPIFLPGETYEDWMNIERMRFEGPMILSHVTMAKFYYGHVKSFEELFKEEKE